VTTLGEGKEKKWGRKVKDNKERGKVELNIDWVVRTRGWERENKGVGVGRGKWTHGYRGDF